MPQPQIQPHRLVVPLATRRRIEDAVEKLIAFIDALEDPDMDREDDDASEETGDAEPSLGSTNHKDQSKAWGASFPGDDLEFEGDGVAECDREDGHDREDDPAESGIADYDGYIEQLVGEPSLGSTLDTDQQIAWGADRASGVVDGERSGTEEDIVSHKSVEAWKADRAVRDENYRRGSRPPSTASGDCPMTSPSDSPHDRFGAAYSEWLKARGAYYEPDLEDDECNRRGARHSAAELALIATPAMLLTEPYQKWAVVEAILTEERDIGERTYPLAVVGLAALKADLLAMRLTEETGG